MKSNPFYALSASAMLLGCWLLSQALELEAGQLRGLLLLILVLQLYELLLVGLGTFLVRTKRAPRDGLVVLVLESAFLMNVTGLPAECVTITRGVGALVALGTVALGVLKLWWVRRHAPDLLPKRVAVVLGAHAALVLALPVATAELAAARLLTPVVLYGLWWITAALPLARSVLRDATHPQAEGASRAHAFWTWMPSGLVLWSLWSLGYVHTLDFRPAFLAPFLLGLAAAAPRERLARQIILAGIAVLFSLGNDPDLVVRILGPGGMPVSSLRLAFAGVGTAWACLAWRDANRWLAAGSLGSWLLALLGSAPLRLIATGGRSLGSALPRDAFGWGALALVAAFTLLAAGARRSLHGEPRWPGRRDGGGKDARTADAADATDSALGGPR